MRGQTFIALDYEVVAGWDVDKRSLSVTFTPHQGFLKALRLPYRVDHLLNHGRKHVPEQQVAFAYAAGPTGSGLDEGLVGQAYRWVSASPSMLPKAPGQRVKTNRLDSGGRAETLRGGHLKSIPVPSAVYRELRHLTQLRDPFVSELAAMKQRSQSLLVLEGRELPPAPAGSPWSGLVKDHLRTLPGSTTVRCKLAQLLDRLAFTEQQGGKPTKEVRRFGQPAPELLQGIKYLMTLPGLGWSVASQRVARIGDWRELRNLRQLGGCLGVVPTEQSTGDRTERGSITTPATHG